MVLLELFWSFLKIGFTSFGGLSMIPLINDEVLSHGWMTASEGGRHCGHRRDDPRAPWASTAPPSRAFRRRASPGPSPPIWGSCPPPSPCAPRPPCFFERVKGNKYMEHILVGVRPACLGMVVGVTCSMLTNYLGASGQVSLPAVGIGVLDLVLLLKGKQSVPVVIGISALLGLLCFGVLGWQ